MHCEASFALDVRGFARKRATESGPRAAVSEGRMLESDRELLEGFRRGDRRALDRVYRGYAGELVAFLKGGFTFRSGDQTLSYRGTQSTFQIEDWLHEVFLRAFSESARAQYDGLRPYGAYLKMIARNLVLDELRRKEHRVRVEVEVLPEPGEAGDFELQRPCSPEDLAEQSQLQDHIDDFIAQLPPREQEVYRRRFREGFDQKDVARDTGISISKVKTSEKRIREGFLAYLIEKGWLDTPVEEGTQS